MRNLSCAMALLVLQSLSAAAAIADDATEVVAQECWVKFIDRVTLASPRAGILSAVRPIEGDRVHSATEIGRLWDETAQAAYATAKKEAEDNVDVRYARKAAEVARFEWEAAVDANRTTPRAVPAVEVERLRLAWQRAVLQIEKGESDFATAGLRAKEKEVELKTYVLQSPFEGIVTRVFKQNGEAVQQGDPVFEVVNPYRVRVEGYVSPAEARLLKRGLTAVARMEPAPGVRPLDTAEAATGELVFIDVSDDPVLKKVRIWAEIDNRKEQLRVGQTSRLTIRFQPAVAHAAERRLKE